VWGGGNFDEAFSVQEAEGTWFTIQSEMRRAVRVAVSALVFLAVGCIGSSAAPTGSAEHPAPTLLSGGAPGICGSASPRLVSLSEVGVGHVLGRRPAWAGVYADYDGRRGAYRVV
jgi:hypothetical protein